MEKSKALVVDLERLTEEVMEPSLIPIVDHAFLRAAQLAMALAALILLTLIVLRRIGSPSRRPTDPNES